jgi:hypothetical protein
MSWALHRKPKPDGWILRLVQADLASTGEPDFVIEPHRASSTSEHLAPFFASEAISAFRSSHVKWSSWVLFRSDGWNAKMSHRWPASTNLNPKRSRENVRSPSASLLYTITWARDIISPRKKTPIRFDIPPRTSKTRLGSHEDTNEGGNGPALSGPGSRTALCSIGRRVSPTIRRECD